MRFAVNEITFVHVFRCDNDSTSSPSDPPSSSNPSILGSFHDLTSHSDDNKQLQLDNESKATNSIPHPIDSPSPSGSATADDTDWTILVIINGNARKMCEIENGKRVTVVVCGNINGFVAAWIE
ncbi:hypothetical protein JHK82_042760 [Glycine max]|nr:hypothetical protein JHK86_042788 [Glycine max]KAG4957043.1 hypothetical protein JHK85_043423 [Glycine max]KAG5105790.1 hypothetical protein JHK82_042760 [Glycine max]